MGAVHACCNSSEGSAPYVTPEIFLVGHNSHKFDLTQLLGTLSRQSHMRPLLKAISSNVLKTFVLETTLNSFYRTKSNVRMPHKLNFVFRDFLHYKMASLEKLFWDTGKKELSRAMGTRHWSIPPPALSIAVVTAEGPRLTLEHTRGVAMGDSIQGSPILAIEHETVTLSKAVRGSKVLVERNARTDRAPVDFARHRALLAPNAKRSYEVLKVEGALVTVAPPHEHLHVGDVCATTGAIILAREPGGVFRLDRAIERSTLKFASPGGGKGVFPFGVLDDIASLRRRCDSVTPLDFFPKLGVPLHHHVPPEADSNADSMDAEPADSNADSMDAEPADSTDAERVKAAKRAKADAKRVKARVTKYWEQAKESHRLFLVQCLTFDHVYLWEALGFYNQMDCAQLADVLSEFRAQSQADVLREVGTPGLGFKNLLTAVTAQYGPNFIEVPPSTEIAAFIRAGYYGGLSQAAIRFVQANPCLGTNLAPSYYPPFEGPPQYDPSRAPCWIRGWDFNSLYPFAMAQHIPYTGGAWVEQGLPELQRRLEEEARAPIHSLPNATSEKIYQLEVDLYWPLCAGPNGLNGMPLPGHHDEECTCLHSFLSDFPPLTCRKIVTPEENEDASRTAKLVATLEPQLKASGEFGHVCFDRRLLCYLRHGARILKIHRALEFDAAPFATSYIDDIVKQRGAPGVPEEQRDFLKLCINSPYGKFAEKELMRPGYEIIKNDKQWRSMLNSSRGDLNRMHIIEGAFTEPFEPVFAEYPEEALFYTPESSPGVALAVKYPPAVTQSKAVQVAAFITDFAKVTMSETYLLMKLAVPSLRMIATDTDSMICHMAEDPYPLFARDPLLRKAFAGHAFPPSHPLYSAQDDLSTLGLLKEETFMNDDAKGKNGGAEMIYIASLRSKVRKEGYVSLRTGKEIEGKTKVKGVGKLAAQEQLLKEDFRRLLDDEAPVYVDACNIRANNFKNYIRQERKKALSLKDDKRIWSRVNGETGPLENESRPYGFGVAYPA